MVMVNKGLNKLTEECGELLQVIGKILSYGVREHPDSDPRLLLQRLKEEAADVKAAIDFVTETFEIDDYEFDERCLRKYQQFVKWDEDPDA